MKLFERLRWLPTERLMPGTAEVSGNSCVLPTLAGATPGTSSARSRKFRPFNGRVLTSACETVPAIWLRFPSSTAISAVTLMLVSTPATASDSGNSYAAPAVSVRRRVTSRKPCRRAVILVRPDLQVRKPEPPVRVGDCRDRDVRFGMTNGDLRIGDDGSGAVRHTSADAGVVNRLLRKG